MSAGTQRTQESPGISVDSLTFQQKSSYCPAFTPFRKERHTGAAQKIAGPSGFFESLTATPPTKGATSTHAPLFTLCCALRH